MNSFVFEKIMVKSADICIMENGYKDGALWKKAAPLSLGFGAPEGLSDAQISSGGLELCPHGYTDRPLTVPVKSRNLGFTGAFSRLEKGCCLTGEYAVSSAGVRQINCCAQENGLQTGKKQEDPVFVS